MNMEIKNDKVQISSLKLKCRVCLQTSKNMMSIFTKVDGEMLSKKIADCGDIKIEDERNDNFYPDKICSKCIASLNVAHKFRETCKNSDIVLYSLLFEFKIEPDPDISNAVAENSNLDHEIQGVDKIDENDTEQFKVEDELYNELCEDIDTVGYLINNSEHEIADKRITKQNGPNNKTEKCVKVKVNKSVSKPSKKQSKKIKTKISDKKNDSVNSIKKYMKSNNFQKQEQKTELISNHEIDTAQVANNYICEICGNKYKKKNLLNSHLLWHNSDKQCKCEVCGKGFTVNSQLKRHMRVHTGDKPYDCNYCGRKFSDYSTCTRHKRTHTNERPYKCNICEKSFAYSCVLKAHIRIHTGEKPFICNQCGKGFYQKHKLKAHLATLFYQNGCKTPSKNKKSK